MLRLRNTLLVALIFTAVVGTSLPKASPALAATFRMGTSSVTPEPRNPGGLSGDSGEPDLGNNRSASQPKPPTGPPTRDLEGLELTNPPYLLWIGRIWMAVNLGASR
jgi:hypothetical protein